MNNLPAPAAESLAATPRPWALGLMSGTSMDGVDAALLRTDGRRVTAFGPALTHPYGPDLRRRLAAVLGRPRVDDTVAAVATEITDVHAEVVQTLLARAELGTADICAVGFHGHTIHHDPAAGLTLQIGDGARLARSTGLRVVADLRAADVAAGGQGAPLVPVYHAALAADLPRPLAVLNLGGVGNITYMDADHLIAFDTGPGNALLDDWAARHTDDCCDRDGALARAGAVNAGALAALMDHPYFAAPPPKSLDRNAFSAAPVAGLSAADGAATLTAFTAETVAAAQAHLPAAPGQWLVTGGGRRNPALMAALADRLPAPVRPVEAAGAGQGLAGWDGDALEAQAFAFLAVRALQGLPLTFPGTTGVPAPQTGGVIYTPGDTGATWY